MNYHADQPLCAAATGYLLASAHRCQILVHLPAGRRCVGAAEAA